MSSYRVVHLLFQSDADLFDAIYSWKEEHPTLWVDDAIDAFATARGADALANLVYSTEAFDIILKYNALHEDLAPIFDYQVKTGITQCPETPGGRNSIDTCCTNGVPCRHTSGPSRHVDPEKARSSLQLSSVSPHPPGSPSSYSVTCPSPLDSGSPSRITRLRQSPSRLITRALSLKSVSKSNKSSPQVDHPNSLSMSSMQPCGQNHVSVPIPSSTVTTHLTERSTLQLLEPIDCSTEMFPSTQASTVAEECVLPREVVMGITVDDRANAILQHTQTPPSRTGPHCQTVSNGVEVPPVAGYGPQKKKMKKKKSRPTKARLREWKTQLRRRDFQLALLKEGLFLELEKSINSDAVYVKVIAPFWRLEEEAQKTMCKADLANRDENGVTSCAMRVPLNETAPTSHLTLALMVDQDSFGQVVEDIWFVNSVMMRTECRNYPFGRKMGLRSALRYGAYSKLYALHDGPYKAHHLPRREVNDRAQLRVNWSKRFWRGQPLDQVNAYYGERIGIYFAWLGHYTKWLTIPAVVGIGVFVFGIINAARLRKLDATPNTLFAIFDNALTMPFALFMSIWSTVYIEFWKRSNQYYAFRWNMNDYERVELPRTEFRPTRVRYSAVTGRQELYYPLYWKALRIFASSIAVFLALAVVIGSVACLMIFKTWCSHHVGGPYLSVLATAILNLIIIIILGEASTLHIWCRLAEWLTDKENHKYTDAYEDSLIIKRYLFDFTNMYSTLFYYAFFKAALGSKVFKDRPDLQDACLYDACITELTVQLAVVFIGKQFLNGLYEMVFPWINRTWNRKKILAEKTLKRREYLESRKRERAPQWVKDDDLPSYEGRILKCYRKTVIQFGFCTLFVTSFPVAPAFALINNWIDIRMEAFRLSTQYRRPIAFRAQDIGMWEKIMEFVSFTSVITNAAIIAFSSLWIKQNLFDGVLHAQSDGELLAARLGFILVFEHVVFLFKIVLRAAIPSVPLTIKLAVQRSKYMTRVANEGMDSELDEGLDIESASPSDEEEYSGLESCSSVVSSESELPSQDRPHSGLQGPTTIKADATIATTTGVDLVDNLNDERTKEKNKPNSRQKAGLRLRRLWGRYTGSQARHNSLTADNNAPNTTDTIAAVPEDPTRETNSAHGKAHQDPMGLEDSQRGWRAEKRRDSFLGPELCAIGLSQPGDGLGTGSGPIQATQDSNPRVHRIPSQRRPPPQRSNTAMDGEWVMLEEQRV
ncbi:Anoctamin-5 [Lunasporangiospora selenospora]|uniref:Anoctamin-5 n=1 Tax=Lunasporangiospora selenospora TaxID=979761 RepID=A0A9P6FSU8_9FUNG|nr:Anoctamin-5 [Lunasporangiospora selenospora]